MNHKFEITRRRDNLRNFQLGMRMLFLFLMVLGSLEIFSQLDVGFYNQANLAFSKKQYLLADSLYTVSISHKPSAEAFFNRAATKIVLKDTCSACRDLLILKNIYLDKEAVKLFQEFCLKKIDTIYYDNKFLPTSATKKYKYYEIIPQLKCDTFTIGEIHKINHKETEIVSPMNLKYESSDIFAQYILLNKIKYYTFVYTSTFEIDNRYEFEKFEESFEKYFSNNYDLSKIEYKDKWVELELFINNEGKIATGKIVRDPFERLDEKIKNKIRQEMIIMLRWIPKLIPEKLVDNHVGRKFNITLGIGK